VVLAIAKKTLLLPLLNAIVLGLMVGALFLYLGFQHNPQGVFFDQGSGDLNLGPSARLFLSGMIPVITIVFLAELSIHSMVRGFALLKRTSCIEVIDILFLPGLDAIILALLLGVCLLLTVPNDPFHQFASISAVVTAAVVFCVELIVQEIALKVRKSS
jgi:hypothetical protein